MLVSHISHGIFADLRSSLWNSESAPPSPTVFFLSKIIAKQWFHVFSPKCFSFPAFWKRKNQRANSWGKLYLPAHAAEASFEPCKNRLYWCLGEGNNSIDTILFYDFHQSIRWGTTWNYNMNKNKMQERWSIVENAKLF